MTATLLANRRNGRGLPLAAPAVVRCAIYCRVSTTERLGQEFNSLDNQQGMCEAYVASQAGAGWTALPDRYHDGGFTGANTERPALRRLLADVESGRVGLVLVYRLDRLTRSMRDFIRMVDVFERRGVAFASVSESFNTTTPVGRMTMHVLLSFSQFEREVTAERTRDKVRAARRRGQWTGGCLALGFDLAPGGKKLVVNEAEAFIVRELYRLYAEHGSLIEVARLANENGWTTKRTPTNDGKMRGGVPWSKTSVHRVLTSPAYVARQIVEGEAYATDHPAIVDLATWEAVQARLESNGGDHTRAERHRSNALLAGILKCSSCGASMTPTHCRKGPRRYHFYACSKRQKGGKTACPAPYISGPKIEAEYVARIASLAGDPRLVEAVCVAATEQLAEKKRAVTDELRALNRAIKDCERERERLAREGNGAAVARLDARLSEHRGRLDAVQAARAAIDSVTIDAAEIAGLLRDDFASVWGAMTSREKRRVVELVVDVARLRFGEKRSRGGTSLTTRLTGLLYSLPVT